MKSLYLTMRDGVRIAIDVWTHDTPGKVPTAVRSTRYWRSTVGVALSEKLQGIEAQRWLKAGFALVWIDARGSGASFGTWLRPWSDTDRDDLGEVIDWIVAQDWSDGTVGGYGTSYDGSTAHLLACTKREAVKAVVPRFALFDPYHHISAPGGVPLDWFRQVWAAGNWHLDGHPDRASLQFPAPLQGGPRPVDEDPDQEMLEQARIEHAGNWDLWASARDGISREDAIIGADGISVEQGSAFGRIAELHAAKVPMWIWSSWYDGCYAAAALAQLADPDLDVRVTLGPWPHGGAFPATANPFGLPPGAPPDQQELNHNHMTQFMRHHQTASGSDPSPKRLRYYTLGEEEWHDADAWPPAGIELESWFFNEDGALGLEPNDHSKSVSSEIDFSATTGTSTRWHSLIGGVPVVYPDRRDEDKRLICWTSEALESDLEITGTPGADLWITSDTTDCAVHLYLESVDPAGAVTYLTEGQLRAVHRRPGAGSPPYETYGVWHSYSVDDLEPLTPGQPANFVFSLWPISALIKAGHRVRIALAGADAGIFRRVPDNGPVTLEILLDRSRVELPVSRL